MCASLAYMNLDLEVDGILGIKDIRKLKLGIDTENKRLINQYLEIPFQYRRYF